MDLFTLVAKLTLDSSSYEQGIDKAKNTSEDAGTKIPGVLSKIGAAVASAFAVDKIIDFTKSVVGAYGEYEQLVGGIDTLFKDSSSAVQQYAADAYKNQQISANKYMELATSFSASLISSLDGDTAKAAEVANTAITDMSDNANKMGTDMTMIQNAYQGFAKQNYTMLDNLKLGYGGTKEEMERLLEDASELSGIEYDISSFADVAEAIHVIQENMDIAGTSMGEAMGTVEGSAAMAKAAWENLLVGLGDSNADLQKLVGEFVSSASSALFNVLPVVGNLITSVFSLAYTGLQNGFSQIISLGTTDSNNAIQNVLNTISSRLPEILQKGVDMVTQFAMGAMNNLPTLITAVGNLLSQGIAFILQNMPQFMQKGVELVLNLANGIIQNAPAIITAMYSALYNVLATIGSNLPQFLQRGIEIVAQLAAGLIRAIPSAVAAVPRIVSGIWNAFTSINWAEIGMNIIGGIGNGIINGITSLVSAAKSAASKVVSGVKSFFGIHSPSKKMEDEVGRYIPAGLAKGIENNSGVVMDAMNEINDMVASPIDAPGVNGIGASGGYSGSYYGGSPITINVYAAEGQDAKEIAQRVSEILAKQTQRKKAVYGN